MRNIIRCLGLIVSLCLFFVPVNAQMYPDNYYQNQYPYWAGQEEPRQPAQGYYPGANPMANLQYDQRDAEMILRDQMYRGQGRSQGRQAAPRARQQMYDDYYGHRIHDEGQVQGVMAEARYVASLVRNRNGKAFLVIDKRNFQFYLYDRDGRLLRIGPVAIGKGKTDVGAFETPVGIFPIKTKVPVDDWIRPDWYFVEEGEPIPRTWEERRVPGFFRYKLVFDGTRYIHYAEATGGRLTHGCLGLDWQDAEAVFHTLQVGSYCIIVDNGFLTRLAKGEFPVQKPATKPVKPDEVTPAVTARVETQRSVTNVEGGAGADEKVFRSLW